MATEQHPQEFRFDLSGGHLALDFANTVSRRDLASRRVDHLKSYPDLISFAWQSKVVTAQQAEALQRQAQLNPRRAAQELRKAVALREALFRTFICMAGATEPLPEDIELIDQSAREALRQRRIVRADHGYAWRWEEDSTLERILWPIAQVAAELLVSANLGKVRECEASDCQWLFLDTSRNRSRRWCDMSACGNREKARRLYRRQRAEKLAAKDAKR